MGDDPHFSVMLPTGQALCYSVQGEKGYTFKLISNSLLHLNARFVQDSKQSDVTWIGSLGIVTHYYSDSDSINSSERTVGSVRGERERVIQLRFEARTKEVHVNTGHKLLASRIEKITINKAGNIHIYERQPTNSSATRACSQVTVELQAVGISFIVRFASEHLDLLWLSTGKEVLSFDSQGIIGMYKVHGMI